MRPRAAPDGAVRPWASGWIPAFLAVVRGGSVTAAADELVVTQPSVSSAISALGRELGCELFERAGRGIRLTEAGSAFAPYAADVIGLLERGRRAAREAASASGRRLRIAAVTTAAESFVPADDARLLAGAHPEVELTLDVGNRAHVIESGAAPQRRRGHLRHAAGRPAARGRAAERERDRLHHRARRPRDAGRRSAAAELAGRAWLLREPGSGTRALNEQFLAERGLTPRILELGSNGAIKQAARAGLGISLLSRAAVEAELAGGQLGEIRAARRAAQPAVVRPALVGGPVAAGRWRSSSYLRATCAAGYAGGYAAGCGRGLPGSARAPLAPSATAARAVTSW